MADLAGTKDSSATDDEALADELRKLKLNDVPIVNAQFLEHVVEHLLRNILDRGEWPEHTKLHARFCALLTRDAIREARNAANRSFVLNVIWAGLTLGMTGGLSAEDVERLYAEARSKIARAGGKKSGAVRKANRPWMPHATELAKHVGPNLSNAKIARAISDNWKLEKTECPGHKTLETFVSELRKSGQLPQRSGSFRKRSG